MCLALVSFKNVVCLLFCVVYIIILFVLLLKLGQIVRPEVKQVHFELINCSRHRL